MFSVRLISIGYYKVMKKMKEIEWESWLTSTG